jgi:hypothetical protein
MRVIKYVLLERLGWQIKFEDFLLNDLFLNSSLFELLITTIYIKKNDKIIQLLSIFIIVYNNQ